jgi:hypothetical protein
MFFVLFSEQPEKEYYLKSIDTLVNSDVKKDPWVGHPQNADNLRDRVRHKK